MKLITLIENHPGEDKSLKAEHGFSVYIEGKETFLLFDTGQSGDFVDNAQKLNVDLEKVATLVISHGHYDHANGVPRFLKTIQHRPDFIVGEGFFKQKYRTRADQSFKANGIGFEEADIIKVGSKIKTITEDTTIVNDEVVIYKNFPQTTDFETLSGQFYLKADEEFYLDEFSDEICLGLKTSEGLVLLVGCSHVGIINIVQAVSKRTTLPIIGIIGGTHLIAADEKRCDQTIQALKALPLKFLAVSHCTGDQHIEQLKEAFGERFIFNKTGTEIIL